MRKLVYIFLNTKYPDAFVKRTVFGDAYYCGNEFIGSNNLLKEISDWFDMDMDESRRYLKAWYSSLPVVVSLRSSTNPAVLVSDTVTVNSTL